MSLIVLPLSILEVETATGLRGLCFFLHRSSFIINEMFFQEIIGAVLLSAV